MSGTTPTLLTCPTCNAPLDYDGVHSVIRCKFCGNTSVVPAAVMSDSTGSTEIWAKIQQLFDQGHTEAAVQLFTDFFGSDASDSQAAMEAIAKGRFVTPSASGSHTESELTAIMEQVQQLVSSGQREKAIDLFKLTFNRDQEHAENAIDEIATWNENQHSGFSAENPAVPSPSTKKNKSCILFAVLAGILLVIGVMALALTGAFTPHYYSMQSDILIPSINDKNTLVAGSFYDPNADIRFIGLVDTGSGRLLWKSDPIESTSAHLVSSTDLIYAADGAHLMAFHIEDGTPAWHTEMQDSLTYGDVPMLVTSGRVITMTVDQRITAYDALSGSQVWSRQQSVYDSTLRLSEDSLMVLDYLPGTYDQYVFFLNPITGEQQAVIYPVCNMHNSEYSINSDTGIVVDKAENALYFVFSEGTVQRFDLLNKQLVWNSIDPDSYNSIYQGFGSLLTKNDLFFGNGGALVKIEKSTGNEKILLNNPDYMLIPLAMSGDNLIVRAKKTRGTTQFELWGVNADSGAVTWQRALKNADPIDPPDEMAGLVDDTDWAWTWHFNDDGFVLLTFSGEPNQVVVETLNPADGTSIGKQVIPLKKISGDFYSIPTIINWQGTIAYLDIEGNFYSLDLTTMKVDWIY